MPVEHVEVDKISKHERIVITVVESTQRLGKQFVVAICLDRAGNSLPGKDVGDLPHRNDLTTIFSYTIQKGRSRRWSRVVTPISSADKLTAAVAGEGPCNHPTDIPGIDQLAGHLADIVKPLETKIFFVSSNLKNAVCRSVNNRLARFQVLFSQFVDDRCTRRMAISKQARKPCLIDQRVSQVLWKTRYRVGKVTPVKVDGYAGHLPVTTGCVLTTTGLHGITPGADRIDAGQTRWPVPPAGSCRVYQPELGQYRDMERFVAETVRFIFAASTGFRDMTECIGPAVAKAACVGA